MSHVPSRHVLFDERSLLSEFRGEFNPGEKLYGMFLYDCFLRTQGDLPTPASAERHRTREKPLELAPSSLADGKSSVKSVTFVTSRDSVTRNDTVSVGAMLKNGDFIVTVSDAKDFIHRPCRLLVLEEAVRDSLMQVAGQRGSLTDDALQEILADERVRGNRELARFLAALPDLDGTIDSDGDCILRVSLPRDAKDIPDNTWLVLVIG